MLTPKRLTSGTYGTPRPTRRGVASVLAMMFIVLFGSLAAAMAVVAQGNLRTADSSLKVSRAMSAAETGMIYAAERLRQQTRRFVITEGVVDGDFALEMWAGGMDPSDYEVLDPVGYIEPGTPTSVMEALEFVFDSVDTHNFDATPADVFLPDLDDSLGSLRLKPIAMDGTTDPPYFRITYQILANDNVVRITSEGVSEDISRSLQMDFELTKKIEFAALTPNRIMIGKNVMIDGPIGTRYGAFDDNSPNVDELDLPNGDPVVVRSDFYDLDPDLDDKLDLLYTQVADFDEDQDGRLRPNHPGESGGLAGNPDLVDYDGNEYVDDFDLFLAHFDTDDDRRVVYDQALAVAAGLGALTVEYGVDALLVSDNQLMEMIDLSNEDRDNDGVLGSPNDIQLGWSDGVIDVNDEYLKINGQVQLAVVMTDWEGYHGESFQTVVRGPIYAGLDENAVAFSVEENDMLELTTNMFSGARTWYEAQVPASPVVDLADPPEDPALLMADAEVAGTFYAAGSPPAGYDSWEGVPHQSPSSYDYYQRPTYVDCVFRNVRIPRGNNALYINCTFVGVTYVEALSVEDDEGHWNYTGAVGWNDDNIDGIAQDSEFYTPKFADPDDEFAPMTASLGNGDETAETRLYSNNLRFHNCAFLGSLAGDRIGSGNPGDSTYTHWRNKIQMTGETSMYIDPEDTDLEERIAAGDTIGATSAAQAKVLLESIDAADRAELAKSSILMPGWSVDVGSFISTAPTVKLKGTIVAGVFDIRGQAELDGTLLMTYRPVVGEGPMAVMGSINVEKFNTTIGYFSADAGDNEGDEPEPGEYGKIRIRYDPDALLPDGIPWPATVEPIANTYYEGGGG